MFFTLGMWMFLTTMERSPPAAETVVTVTRAVEEERGMCLTAMERSMRTLVIHPQQQRLW